MHAHLMDVENVSAKLVIYLDTLKYIQEKSHMFANMMEVENNSSALPV